jgi:hypothetical protein
VPGDRLDDAVVAGTPAEDAGDLLADLRLGQLLPAPRQRGGGHQKAGRAEAALQAVLVLERLLQRVEPVVLGEGLDGLHLTPVQLRGEHQARLHRLPVDEHGAHAAHPLLTADVGPGETQPVSQEVRGVHACRHPVGAVLTVDRDRDDDLVRHRNPSSHLLRETSVSSCGGLSATCP